jgi:Recombination endonuclease VII
MNLCPYDPKEMAGKPIGMFHCPLCGIMCVAGLPHPHMKLCNRCGEQPCSNFYRDKYSRDGLRSICKNCDRFRNRRAYAADPDTHRKRSAEWKKQNSERANALNRAYRKAHPEWYRAARRRYKLKYAYGLSLADFDALWEKQQGLCAVPGCGAPATDVDHCHQTNQVRGLLCGKCNRALGLLGEDPMRIEGLARYVAGELDRDPLCAEMVVAGMDHPDYSPEAEAERDRIERLLSNAT